MTSLRAKILAAKPVFVDVPVAEWDATVRVQALSGRDRLELFDAVLSNEKAVEEAEADGGKVERLDTMIMQLVFSLRDPKNGNRLFAEADHNELLQISYSTLEKLYGAFVRLNVEQVTDIETVKKTS